MIRVRCPKCEHSLRFADGEAGAAVSCPECGGKFRLRASAAPSAAASAVAKQTEDDPDEDRAADDPEPAEAAPRKKKRKKKNKKVAAKEVNPLHVLLVVAGVLVVGLATGLFFLIQRGTFSKPKIDPDQVLADLQKMPARVVRDESRPDRPVVAITISGERYDAWVLDKLVAFPELRSLDLNGTLTTDVILEHLRNVTSLKKLGLSHTKVTGGGMQFLKTLVNLEELNLNQTLVTDAGLNELKGLTKLKKIYLDGTLATGLELQEAIPDLVIVK
jgi:hypothetical protein